MSVVMKRKIHATLSDKRIQEAFKNWEPVLKFINVAARSGIDYEAYAMKIHEIKERCIDVLPELIVQFKQNAVAAGAIVYEAASGNDANEYIVKLAAAKGVKNVVKSTSKLGWEIGCVQYMEKSGIEVTETDVGDWILQLAKERPIHMTAPNAHITIEEVTELISRASGEKLQPEPQQLLDAARKTLRKAFIRADMGISGVNIAVAETGTIMIFTNEGNECMTTTMPRIHVALIGIEKLVASKQDAAVITRLLSRANMGMNLPIYISNISGPSRADIPTTMNTIVGQGPAELHLILIDNGRNSLRKSTEFKEALYCIKCGACINVCPVFRSLGGQTYGYVYQGGIGTILTAFLNDFEAAVDLSSLCAGCKACTSICPAHIDIPGMIIKLRAKIVRERGISRTKYLFFHSILSDKRKLDSTIKVANVLQYPFIDHDNMLRWLPPPLNAITNTIALPSIAKQTLYERLKNFDKPGTAKIKVAFFAGCLANYVYPETGLNMIEVLDKYNARPYFPVDQTCCGAPAFYEGLADTAQNLAKKNINALLKENPEYIVTICPGCAVMLCNEYPRLLRDDPEWMEKARKLANKVREFSQLVMELSPSDERKLARNMKITYHDPCHLKRGLNIYSEPRQLLAREGYEIVEMEDCDACCGFGGTILIDYPELSNSILQRKLDNIIASGADIVATNCPACVMQIRGGLDRRKSKIKVMHSAELIATGKR